MAATKNEIVQAARYIVGLLDGLSTESVQLALYGKVRVKVYISKHKKVKGVLDTEAGLLTLDNGTIIKVGRGRYIAPEFKCSA